MKVALVHDWLTGMRGGEKVLERIAAMFPDAPIYTLVWNRGSVSPALESHPIRTSFLQHMPAVASHYRWYLPWFPTAIERFRLTGFDAVISSSHAVARAVRTPDTTFHLSYIHTPMRYVWDLEDQYFPPGRFPWPLSSYVHGTCARLRAWDEATCNRPQVMIAILEPQDLDRLRQLVVGDLLAHAERIARSLHNKGRRSQVGKMRGAQLIRLADRVKRIAEAEQPRDPAGRVERIGYHAGDAPAH